MNIALLAFLCTLIVLLTAGLFLGIRAGGNPAYRNLFGADYELALEEEFSSRDIECLTVRYQMNSNDVYFYEGSPDSIVVKEYRNRTSGEQRPSTVELQDGVLTVQGCKYGLASFFGFGNSQYGYTEIYLPPDFSARLSVSTASGEIRSEMPLRLEAAMTLSSVSGDITLPQVTAPQIKAGSTSGNITFDQITGEVQLSSTSGDIRLKGASEGGMSASSTSGSINLEQITGHTRVSSASGDICLGSVEGDVNASTTSGEIRLLGGNGTREADSVSGDIQIDGLNGSFDLNTTSGAILVEKGQGYGSAHSVSGDLRFFLEGLDGDFDASTTSGEVSLKLPETTSFTLDFKSTSGSCRTFFDDFLTFNKRGSKADGSYGDNPDKKIKVSTVSGDLQITK